MIKKRRVSEVVALMCTSDDLVPFPRFDAPRHAIASGRPGRLAAMDEKRKLKGMLARIFSDATAAEAERAELKAYLSSDVLSMAEIKEVFADFVQTTWKITMADGVISDIERTRLNEIVRVLGLEIESLPEEWVRTLTGSLAPPEPS
jgi:hypothetical protein